MEIIIELGKMLLIGSSIGLLLGLIIRINQYKSKKDKEDYYSPSENTSEIEETEQEAVDYKSLWEEEKRRNSK